ncbi:MAG: hypothetical protein ACXU8O_01695, partial [Asticcacaulis sp.]
MTINTQLQTSTPHIVRLLSALTALIMVGAFSAALAAMVTGFALLLVYAYMLAAGYPELGAVSAALAIFVIILVAAILMALWLWSRAKRSLHQIVDMNTPPAARVINGAGSVAGSFIKGWLGRRRQRNV